MSRVRTRWWIAPLLALLFAPAIGAASRSALPTTAEVGMLSRLLSLFSPFGHLFPLAGTKEGCKIDPNGRCTLPEAKEGCKIDPHGRCLDAARDEEGCAIDPHGRCSQAARSEEGCAIDPNGRCFPRE